MAKQIKLNLNKCRLSKGKSIQDVATGAAVRYNTVHGYMSQEYPARIGLHQLAKVMEELNITDFNEVFELVEVEEHEGAVSN